MRVPITYAGPDDAGIFTVSVQLNFSENTFAYIDDVSSLFARRLNLRDGDMLCCRFDGESTVTVRAFDPSDNSMDPRMQESSSDGSARSRSPSPSSSTAPSSGDSSGGDTISVGSEEDLDVKPSVKRVRQGAL